MGSKKFKRKKLKYKKFRKLIPVKREKSTSLESSNGTDSGENFQEKDIDNQLSSKNYSRSRTEERDVTAVKYFSKIREDYFRYLQTVVSDNCVFCDAVVTEEILENLALELEQNALLACLQVDIYKKSMLKIIADIKKCTQVKQVHEDVKKLLPGKNHLTEPHDGIVEEQQPVELIPTKASDCTVVETYNRIPTISTTRTDENLVENTCVWADQSNYSSDPYYSVTEPEYTENHLPTDTHHWGNVETYSAIPDHSIQNYWGSEILQTSDTDTNIIENSKCAVTNQTSPSRNNFINSNKKDKTAPNQSEEKLDPLLISRNQLQKLVEQTLNETEKINRQKRDEQEKAYIAQILEGDDSLDDRFNDSLSDNENESKENIDETNLMDRLEKMRELFGMEEEESQTDVIPEKQKPTTTVNHVNTRSRRPTIWRYEKFIQLHRYSLIAAEMTFERRQLNRKLFLELFGEDSDEEHEFEYSSTEKFRSSCTERISSWVVKYLMPFYHEKRILGRNVFKSLGHYVSDTIVDKIQYPDEWTVKYLVSKFFPPKKKYICEADILNFQLE